MRRCQGWSLTLILAALLVPPAQAADRLADVQAADRLATEAPGNDRDKSLRNWARNAELAEIMFVLRRSPAELGGAEGPLIEAALDKTPKSRAWLRRRLITRLMLVDPKGARARWGELTHFASELPHQPRASVFRVTALLPDSGAYESYGSSVLAGVELGLEATAGARALPFELSLASTGEDDPGEAVHAFDRAAEHSGVMIGPLLSVPAFAVGTGSRYTALPVVSPTATDESVGSVASTLFQIGPSSYDRGFALGSSVLGERRVRIGVVASDDVQDSPLVRGFMAAAIERGASIGGRYIYAPGSFDFRDDVREILAEGIEVLFWDGDGREAAALLRELARQQAAIEICGGEALSPDRHHTQTRGLLEGVRYVAGEWVLPREAADRIDALGAEGADGTLALRGYLAGRMVGAAVASGALCPEEVTAFLAERLGRKPYLASLGFLDVREVGATLPIYRVEGGQALAQ